MNIEDKMRELRGKQIAVRRPYEPTTLGEFRRTPAGQELDRLWHSRGYVYSDITRLIWEASLEQGVDPGLLQGCYAQTAPNDENHITLRFFATEVVAAEYVEAMQRACDAWGGLEECLEHPQLCITFKLNEPLAT